MGYKRRESQGRQGEESREREGIRERAIQRQGQRKSDTRRKATKHDKHGNLSKEEGKSFQPTYQTMLHDDDFNTIADRVYDSMSELITAFTTTQEALKKTIETQLTELKSLVSHTPHVTIPTPVHSTVIDLEGHRHRFISITPISICRPGAQEGV